MANLAELEGISLTLNYVFITKADAKPVALGLFDIEAKSFPGTFLYLRLHDDKLVALRVDSFNSFFRNQLDIWML